MSCRLRRVEQHAAIGQPLLPRDRVVADADRRLAANVRRVELRRRRRRSSAIASYSTVPRPHRHERRRRRRRAARAPASGAAHRRSARPGRRATACSARDAADASASVFTSASSAAASGRYGPDGSNAVAQQVVEVLDARSRSSLHLLARPRRSASVCANGWSSATASTSGRRASGSERVEPGQPLSAIRSRTDSSAPSPAARSGRAARRCQRQPVERAPCAGVGQDALDRRPSVRSRAPRTAVSDDAHVPGDRQQVRPCSGVYAGRSNRTGSRRAGGRRPGRSSARCGVRNSCA